MLLFKLPFHCPRLRQQASKDAEAKKPSAATIADLVMSLWSLTAHAQENGSAGAEA